MGAPIIVLAKRRGVERVNASVASISVHLRVACAKSVVTLCRALPVPRVLPLPGGRTDLPCRLLFSAPPRRLYQECCHSLEGAAHTESAATSWRAHGVSGVQCRRGRSIGPPVIVRH